MAIQDYATRAEDSKHGNQDCYYRTAHEVVRRLQDGLFLQQLRERIARTYSFFIGRVVDVVVETTPIDKEVFEIGSNYASEKFTIGEVSCNVTAGIAEAKGKVFRDTNAGWFVFCNGRTVLYADKSSITGWGGGAGLPIFQPKHRPFLGIVFFVSTNPEALPWTTTKASVNQESAVWQEAKRHMVKVGRVITGFLDSRYSDDGAAVAPADLQGLSGSRISVLTAAVSNPRAFAPPRSLAPENTRIQYDAKISDVKKIADYLRRPSMSGSEVGRYTFSYFLKNEVGEEQ